MPNMTNKDEIMLAIFFLFVLRQWDGTGRVSPLGLGQDRIIFVQDRWEKSVYPLLCHPLLHISSVTRL